MATEIYARQGDLIIRRLDKIDGELQTVKSIVFAGDSSGHPHTLSGTSQIRKDGRRTFVRVSSKREITHGKSGGHKTVTLNKGDYEIYPLRERGDKNDRAVED